MTKICPICGKMAESFDGNIIEDNEVIWDFTYCKVCGRFELSEANDDPNSCLFCYVQMAVKGGENAWQPILPAATDIETVR